MTIPNELIPPGRYFIVWDRPHFCWLPTRLLTMEVAWLRTVLSRQTFFGSWEYYNQ